MSQKEISQFRIALIPGHSSRKRGASNLKNGMTEFEFGMIFVKKLSHLFKVNKAIKTKVFLRDEKLTTVQGLQFMAADVNKWQAGLCVEFHANAPGRKNLYQKVTGNEMLFWNKSDGGNIAARILSEHVTLALGNKRRSLKPITKPPSRFDTRGWPLLYYTRMPCVLVESFFITNDKDLSNALQKIDELAVKVYEALCKISEEFVG